MFQRISVTPLCLLLAGSGEDGLGALVTVNIILGVILLILLSVIAYEFAIALRRQRGTQKEKVEIEKTISDLLSDTGITMRDGGEKIDERRLYGEQRENTRPEEPPQKGS